MSTNKIKSNLILLFSILLSWNFISCSEQEMLLDSVVENGRSSLTLIIPSIGYNTRAGESMPATDSEKQINDLHLYLFNDDETGSLYKDIVLKETDENSGEDGSVQNSYNINDIQPGRYHAIVTANIKNYSRLPTELTKTSLEETILTFNSENKIAPGNLPMTWFSDENSENDGIITIGKDSNTISAPLTFLCAKVRFTILFNASEDGISKDFKGKIPSIVENSSFINNIVNKTRIKEKENVSEITSEDGENNQWSFSLDKYEYPGVYYPNNVSSNEGPASDLQIELKNENSNEFAWQGKIYIPENLSSDPSEISITLSLDGVESTKKLYVYNNDDESSSHEVKRGNMYDITLSLTSPDSFTSSSAIYRIYWPQVCGPGLYIENFEGSNLSWEESKIIGNENIVRDYYYYEFESHKTQGSFSYILNNNESNYDPNKLISAEIKESFTIYEIEGKKINICYIDEENSGIINELPFSPIKKGDFIYIYWNKDITFILNGQNEFYKCISLWINDSWEEGIFDFQSARGEYFQHNSSANPPGEYWGTWGEYRGTEIFTIKFKLAETETGLNPSKNSYFSVWDQKTRVSTLSDGRNNWKFYIDELK